MKVSWTPVAPAGLKQARRKRKPRVAHFPVAVNDILNADSLSVLPLACLNLSTAGGSRTLKHERLKFAALPVCVPQHVEY